LYAKAGKPFDLYLNPDTTHVSIRPPGGKWETYPVGSNPFTYTNTGTVGIYTISENSKRRRFTVNLLDESESDIAVPVPAGWDGSEKSFGKPEGLKRVATEHSIWPVLILSSLVVLMIEWYVWLRTG
jgi:hypothetical protein